MSPTLPSSKDADAPRKARAPHGEGSQYRGRVLGKGQVRVRKLMDGKPLKVWLPLDGGSRGRLLIDLAYAQYVDPRPL